MSDRFMMPRKQWHANITDEAILAACDVRASSLDNTGFCLLCGIEQEGCEPDARYYTCEACGAEQVFGAEELLQAIA